jgi:hypothetical protein
LNFPLTIEPDASHAELPSGDAEFDGRTLQQAVDALLATDVSYL